MASLTKLTKEEADKMGVKAKLGDFKETFQEAEVRVTDWANEEGAKLKEVYKSAEENVTDAVKSFSELVNKNPVASVVAGFGVGCVAGLIASALTKKASK